MKIQFVRSATLRMEYAGRRFVIDPYLAAKHSRPSFTGKSPNPLVDLPRSPRSVIAGIEMVLVSHLHSDHFGPWAHRRTKGSDCIQGETVLRWGSFRA